MASGGRKKGPRRKAFAAKLRVSGDYHSKLRRQKRKHGCESIGELIELYVDEDIARMEEGAGKK